MLGAIEDSFHWTVFFACLLGALFIQVGTNYVNDASDFLRGADESGRTGPRRLAAAGILSVKELYWAAAAVFFLAGLVGVYLSLISSPWIFLLGLISVVFAVAYTAGPFPLAYLGLGDLFVFVFFGLVAVAGTYYCQSGGLFSWQALAMGALPGAHATALIAINNLRDIETDTRAGKRTLAVKMGSEYARVYYVILLFLPYVLWPLMGPTAGPSLWWPYLSVFIPLWLTWKVSRAQDPKDYLRLLPPTALLQMLFGLLCLGSLSRYLN
jgi:1,4-dihydroxy-2-naphthoate polyprenyltransferase